MTAMREVQGDECLSRLMRSAGHSLDWGCGLCFANCIFSAPCGCGSPTCIDVAVGARRNGVAAAA